MQDSRYSILKTTRFEDEAIASSIMYVKSIHDHGCS